MSIQIVVQNEEGDEEGANSYQAVTDFKAYHTLRGNSYAGKSDDQIASALINGTDYIDTRWTYKGTRVNGTAQTTQWPREGFTDREGNDVEGIHAAVVRATSEYAFRALTITLYQDAPAPTGGRPITQQSKTVGPISKSTTWADAQGVKVVLPEYPAADRLLQAAGLIRSGSTVDR